MSDLMEEANRQWHESQKNLASATPAANDGELSRPTEVISPEVSSLCPCRKCSPMPELPSFRITQLKPIESRIVRHKAFWLEFEGIRLYVDSYGWTFDNRSGVSRPFKEGMNHHIRTLLGIPSGTAPKARGR